jgi:hypothetical protein
MRAHPLCSVLTLAFASITGSARADDLTLLERFNDSRVSLTSAIGTGSFVSSEFSDDPYFSQSLALEPRFLLAEQLFFGARFDMECELTEPNSPSTRRCSPSDLSLSFSALNLLRDPWLNGQVRGGLSLYLPTSLESRFNNTVVNLRASTGYSARFFDERLQVSLGVGLQKYLPTQITRGPDAGNADFPLILSRQSAISDGAAGSGGRLNDNWALSSSFFVGWQFFDQLSATISFGVYNYFRFTVPEDFSDPALSRTGRVDLTSGSLEVSYRLFDNLAFDFGVVSTQPAMTADNSSLRFPFYDFISPANNYTRWYLTAHLSY